jgi:hypothetical protein
MRVRVTVRLVGLSAVRVFGVSFVAVGVLVIVFMGVLSFAGEHVDLGPGQAAANDSTLLQTRTYVEGGGGLRKQVKGNAGIDQCAEQHIAADSGKTLKVSSTHGEIVLNSRG